MNMAEVVEIADEKHSEPWMEMLATSKPSIQSTPLSAALPEIILRKNRCHLDSSQIREIVGWSPKHARITVKEIVAIRDAWRKEGIFPNAITKAK